VQDGQYRLSAAWRHRDARRYSPLPTVRAFGWIAPPTMPSADFCAAVRSPYDDLSLECETQRRPPEVRPAAFAARPPDLPPRSLMTLDFAITCPLVRPGRPLYPVLVHRAAALLHASFRPHLVVTPLRFANPSPPSGWIEDSHLQAVDHARHTRKRAASGAGGPSLGRKRPRRAAATRSLASLHRNKIHRAAQNASGKAEKIGACSYLKISQLFQYLI